MSRMVRRKVEGRDNAWISEEVSLIIRRVSEGRREDYLAIRRALIGLRDSAKITSTRTTAPRRTSLKRHWDPEEAAKRELELEIEEAELMQLKMQIKMQMQMEMQSGGGVGRSSAAPRGGGGTEDELCSALGSARVV